MAYAALTSLAQTTDQILNHDYYPVSLPGKKEIKSIYDHAVFLQAFLDDFPEKTSSLEGRITDIANEAEVVIEYFISKKIQLHGGLIESGVGPSRTKFRRQLKKVAEKIGSIAAEVMDMKNSFIIKDVGVVSDTCAASSSSRLAPTSKDAMVGFDEDLMAIKARLCEESSKLQVLPIVGMGGIGKTTLARNAYDDPLIIEIFHVRAWVTVSQDYNAQEVLSRMLVSLEEFNTGRFRRCNESVEEKVYKELKGRRYLIVLDDMWSTKAWDDLKMILPDDHNGSRIMLTTRLLDVAAYADPSGPVYEMHFMDADQSWNLLQQKVFSHPYSPGELVNIGKKIAKACRGLPLAVVLIAGLLSTVSQTGASWDEIAQDMNSTVASKDGQFDKIISLSYSHLPHHLRPYFLYMGGFPEDYEIRVSLLIKLWVAEGFLRRQNGSKSLEEEAEEYLEDLVKRSLVLVTKRKSNGKIKSCGLHDLVWDLCRRTAQQEKFLVYLMDRNVGEILPESIKHQRRVSVARSDLYWLSKTYDSTIHTVISFQPSDSLFYLESFRLLRVLDMVTAQGSNSGVYSELKQLPSQVFELFHLRYLAFPCPMDVPSAILNLQNLQTLIIHPWKTWAFVCLPLEIWRMPRLRHLVCFYFYHLTNPEGASFPLENLQTLLAVRNLRCTKRIMKMMPNLKRLALLYTGQRYDQDYQLENLCYLHQLENLKLEFHGTSERKLDLAFPRTLRKLTLIGGQLSWKDMNIVGSLPNLKVLKLRDDACQGGHWETNDGEFSQLKFLLVEKSDLRHWITESSHFPSLKYLLIHRCQYLSEIPDGIGEIPTLELIKVKNCQKSLADSARQIQEEQQSWGNDALQIRCMEY